MKIKAFEQLVREAIATLPLNIKETLKNVAFVIEKEVRRKKSNETGIRVNEMLLGLYEGVPEIKLGANNSGILPDKITIFQKPIEELAGRSEEKLKKLVYEVVWHEVGHRLGFEESELRALEAKKKKL